MENGEFAPISKCSIFHNIFKYMIFQRHQKVVLWSKGLNIINRGTFPSFNDISVPWYTLYMNFLRNFIFQDIFYFQTVCETIISYQNKAISKISKKCDTASLCERIRDGSSSLCRSSARTPYCVYCCDTQLCNEEIEVLEFKGNAMDFKKEKKYILKFQIKNLKFNFSLIYANLPKII